MGVAVEISPMDPFRKVRVHPRMSAPLMGRYLVARAPDREGILRDAKFPRTFKPVHYRQAEDAVRRALLQQGDVPQHLAEGQQRILTTPPRSKHGSRVQSDNVDAVRRFALTYPELPLDGAAAMPVPRLPHIMLEGVTISVHPCVLLARRARGGVQHGALVLGFGREHPIDATSGRAVAELLREGLERAGIENVRPELCLVVDVPTGAFFTAPTRGRQVQRELGAACREIAGRWPLVQDTRAA